MTVGAEVSLAVIITIKSQRLDRGMSTEQHLVLARKWRPRQFDQFVGQEHVVRAIVNALNQNRLHHAYLFSGTRGVGKTTLARILAKCLNCEQGVSASPCGECQACLTIDQGRFIDLIEVDAASRTKVEDTRDLLDNVQYAPTVGRYKIYLIDEVHMLSGHSFNALLKTLEEPPPHVKFLLATTDPQKLPITVLSRCLQFHLKNLSPEQIQQQLAHVLTEEQLPFESEALALLANAARGSMRDGLSLLDQAIAFGNGQVNTSDVSNMLGTIDQAQIHTIIQSLADQDAEKLLDCAAQLAEQGSSFTQVLDDLLTLLQQVAIAQQVNKPIRNKVINEFAQRFAADDIQLYYQIGLIGKRDLPLAPSERSGFEMVLLRMLAFAPNSIGITSTAPNNQGRTNKQTPAQPTKANNSQTQTNDWAKLLNELNLQGAAKALANHCTIKQQSENTLLLQLDQSQKPLLNNNIKNRIRQAICQYFGRELEFDITTGEQQQESPAAKVIRKANERQHRAEQHVAKDEQIQAILSEFDGKIVPESTRPIEE